MAILAILREIRTIMALIAFPTRCESEYSLPLNKVTIFVRVRVHMPLLLFASHTRYEN